ncbi:unnamed protein product (macronuclear) [Paramecium tetraurelia]|uniref:Uncharacterized protein n=1 Tax=Paramecium tetraurelia TaxID=5888 RepID=A0BT49_PARTE|nr:uncharacterized protein GSPATT00031948001 [Paramecium tetraurelia]CAK61716.1 unnamed protein product [Paramecium tetraurelia]|eukprot:XP_001429114.1 hypothetical protein (macronuclear) [Paramecium tetraurelia strain d4-2]
MDKTLQRIIRLTQKQVDAKSNCYFDQYSFNYTKDLLGEGSFGSVYRGTQGNKFVAIKILNLKFYDNPAYKQALKNEITLMMELQSPNVVRILDALCDQHDNELFLIIEYCEGGDLRHLLSHQPNQRFQESAAIAIISQTIQGLSELLHKNYMHRDIKPDNILLKQNTYKVADFGLAAKIPPKQVLRAQAGTPLYMSPQLLEGKEYSNKCDIWSLGLVLYELLFGRTPWLCRSFDTYLMEIQTKPLQFPYEIEISANVKDFIKRCLKIEEQNRMSWTELLKHPMLQAQGKLKRQATQERLNFTVLEREYLYNIQLICAQHNFQAKDLMKQCGKTHINQEEFQNMLRKIMNQDNDEISKQLFGKFDQSKDGLISAQEFEYLFSEYDFAPIDTLAVQITHELQAIIKIYQISLKQLFEQLDQDKNGFLDQKEFEFLIKKIAPKLSQKNIFEIFKNYDQDNDGKISLKELKFVLQSKNYQKLKIILNKIRETLMKKSVSTNVLFTSIDADQKGYLNFKDFEYFIGKIDKVSRSDVQDLFNLFDEDENGKISLNEFNSLLNL